MYRPLLCFLLILVPPLLQAKLVFWNSQNEKEYVQTLAEEFSLATDIEVEVNWIHNQDYKTTLLLHAYEGDFPDVALVPADFLGVHRHLKLSPLSPSLIHNYVPEKIQSAASIEGKLYGVPVFWGNHLMLYYNKKYVDEPAKNWDELVDSRSVLTKRGAKNALALNINEMYWFVPFLGAFGGWPMDGSKIDLNSSSMKQSLVFYRYLLNAGIIPKDCDSICVHDGFKRGESAYSISGDWAYKDFEKSLGNDFGVAILPSVGNKPMVSMYSTYVLVFPGSGLEGPKRQALEKFISYMHSKHVQRSWFSEAGLLPVREDVYKEVIKNADKNLSASLAQLSLSREMPVEPGMSYAWEAMVKGVTRFLRGIYTVEKATMMMQQQAIRDAKRNGDYQE
ncbi:MAG: hypothetical protein CMF25_01905 [Kangiellaceae bacterium]|nr:hypothetical protein [Kangiellaceae bacterium]